MTDRDRLTTAMKLLIVDDHPVIRHGLRQLIEEDFKAPLIGEAGTARELLDSIRSEEWDLVILDVNLPDRNGLEALKEAKRLRPELPFIVLSLYPEEQYAMRAFKAGASAYLTKDRTLSELLSAIRKVRAGGRYVSTTLAEHLAQELAGGRPTPSHHLLSDRELEVLRLLAKGKTVSQIGDQLALSVKTVSTYRARLLEKLRLHTTAELIRYALDHNLAA